MPENRLFPKYQGFHFIKAAPKGVAFLFQQYLNGQVIKIVFGQFAINE